ncbi:hypothetical protein AMS66_12520 [Paenibacillus xylanivorans]|uniref:Uncharacterized protein n=1 Tax=Paenibacillus xylanivorans TaxID=1705561 RepID=A0A0N0UHV1_9BACL|nr:hypothetical protein AMS66_12520 [Paenibacillus xylanivorans]
MSNMKWRKICHDEDVNMAIDKWMPLCDKWKMKSCMNSLLIMSDICEIPKDLFTTEEIFWCTTTF